MKNDTAQGWEKRQDIYQFLQQQKFHSFDHFNKQAATNEIKTSPRSIPEALQKKCELKYDLLLQEELYNI